MNLVQLVSAVLACLSLVQARPCTLSQLTGSNGNFAITGGPDLSTPIQTGTTQIISFNWAVGCPVKAINSILVIPASQAAANGTTLDTTPSSVSFGRGLTHDLAAFLSTSIPATVPSGRYTFRAILSTTTGPCSIDSTPFQVLSVSLPGPLPTGPVPDPNSINCPENADDHNPSPGSPCSYKGIVIPVNTMSLRMLQANLRLPSAFITTRPLAAAAATAGFDLHEIPADLAASQPGSSHRIKEDWSKKILAEAVELDPSDAHPASGNVSAPIPSKRASSSSSPAASTRRPAGSLESEDPLSEDQKYDFEVVDFDKWTETQAQAKAEHIPHARQSPEGLFGTNRIGQIRIPKELTDGINSLIQDQNRKLLKEDAYRIFDALRSTGKLEHNMLPKSSSKHRKNERIPEPHILEYGYRESLAYAAVRLPLSYASTVAVLSELKKRLPDFEPRSVLDFGTGPGSALWATRYVWPSTKINALGVDVSEPMLQTATQLGGYLQEHIDNWFSSLNFRRYLSFRKSEEKHDMVIAAFALSDLPTDAIRQSTLQNLWSQTGDILVLIDRGIPAGAELIAKARQYILDLENDAFVADQDDMDEAELPEDEAEFEFLEEENGESKERTGAFVVAPCPHDHSCPMLEQKSWCHFSQSLQRTRLMLSIKDGKMGQEDIKYSYVVIRRGKRPVSPTLAGHSPEPHSGKPSAAPDLAAASFHWPRLVAPPMKRDGHVVLDTCGVSGALERFVIGKSKGKLTYYDARKSHWGDLWPHKPTSKVVTRLPKLDAQLSGQASNADGVNDESDGSDDRIVDIAREFEADFNEPAGISRTLLKNDSYYMVMKGDEKIRGDMKHKPKPKK
ncbi:mitochondrial small ribosomal subunit Rsm22-domain-containing protein [Polychytrium aggregatum]|uniref:mitochondrial small ribosomal subunit Rsm22-domain-containing protein n=1 Tax=Polychytrium aggregatum TaxID=110093 RepID=UPI0022FF243D|nr:mitochondrial small ribosomal subunit Rsm22-domain-containing protein [Polychytrium aggregatum]KAI9204581.1 mitochondrial small ribosomal subunit Rsm22-domain-containing protein [Polychytrium aggregatum]